MRPRVLIVDDELGVRESLRTILDRECDVLTAASGDEALAIIAREPLDLVTLDLRMPGLGGIAVLERIRQIDPDIEAVIITGYGSLDTAIEGLRHRAFDYIAKPFDCDKVCGVVQAALARRLAARRLRSAPEQILATLSHEFRTPLNVIMGYSTMLQDDGPQTLSDEQRLALDRIQANSTALLAYVETLFYMAELDRGAVPVQVAPVRVSEVLAHVADELRAGAVHKGLALAIDASAALEVASDGDKLARLVRALVDNAIRHTASGTVMLTATAGRGGAVVVEVRDGGVGMAPDVADEARAVARGAASPPPRLLGFGLRLVGRLARVLGATLDIAADATGTRCRITVPAAIPATIALPAVA